jgi:NAD(P)-dependent dehydrogenase (short-subunit alcohol dehydrogenase family)
MSSGLFADKEVYDEIVGQCALGRHALPEEMATAAVFLASEAGSYVNGEVLIADGGTVI